MARRRSADHRWRLFTGSLPRAGQSTSASSASGASRKPGEPPNPAVRPSNLAAGARTPSAKVSSPSAIFEKVLRSFETGGFTYSYVLAELAQLLETGASPTALLEVLRRRELIEPLPQDEYLEIFALLDDAESRIAAVAATSAEAKGADSHTPPDKVAESKAAPEPIPLAPRRPRSSVQTMSAPAALTLVFERVLKLFETSGFTDTDVLSQLRRLLIATGASPTFLLKALRRRQQTEPLPEHAHMMVLGLLKEVIGRSTDGPVDSELAEQTRVVAPTKISPAAAPVTPANRSPAEAPVTPAATKPATPDLCRLRFKLRRRYSHCRSAISPTSKSS